MEVPLPAGIPQGRILGSLLSVIFCNDFAETLRHSEVIQNADDTVLFLSQKVMSVKSRSCCQKALAVIIRYLNYPR